MTDIEQYPEWQKGIRQAQAARNEAQRKAEEAAERKQQQKRAEEIQQANATLKTVLGFLGFPDANPLNGVWQVDNYIFRDAAYSKRPYHVSPTETTTEIRWRIEVSENLEVIEGLVDWYNANADDWDINTPRVPSRRILSDGYVKSIGWDQAKVEVADALDNLDREIKSVRERWEKDKAYLDGRKNAQAERELEAEAPKPPTPEEQLAAALRRFIYEETTDPIPF